MKIIINFGGKTNTFTYVESLRIDEIIKLSLTPTAIIKITL